MVPHRRVLQAFALVAMARADGPEHTKLLEIQYDVKFPVTLVDFTTLEVHPYIPEILEAWFLTTDISSTQDYRPLMQAAEHLKVRDIVAMSPDGPTVILPVGVHKLRANQQVRSLLETSLLCEIELEVICADLKHMYGMNVEDVDVERYAELFVDREYIEGQAWTLYTTCIGQEEALFRRVLIGQPKDFVRWRLGAPVSLNCEQVLDRMMSDAFYTEKLIKRNAGNLGITLSKEELARVKLERETIFKAMDFRNKLHDAAGGDHARTALQMLAGVVAKYEGMGDLPSRADLLTEPDGK